MFVPWVALNQRLPTTNLCTQNIDRKRRQMAEEEVWVSAVIAFQVYGRPLETVSSFKYLGRLITAMDDDWMSVIVNLQNMRKSWSRLSRILRLEGVDYQTLGNLYLTIVQAVLIFSTYIWVLTLIIGRLVGEFHHRLARQILGKQPWRQENGTRE